MDGSIATSATLRMRDQLRGALHAPASGADAGLFEELLRMPALQARPKPKADPPATESDALAEAAAAKAHQKPATKSAREKEEDDADEDSVDEAPAENADGSLLVQPIPTQPTAVEAPTQPTEKVAPPPKEAAAQTQPIASKDASTNQQPQDGNKDAVIERPAEPVAASEPPLPTADGSQQPQVVETAAETPTAPAAEANVSVEPAPAPTVAPTPGPTGGDAAPSDQTPHRSTEVRASTKVPSEPQSVPAPATAQTQPQLESRSQLKPQDQPQASVQAQAQTGVPQSQQTSDEREVRGDNSGERREKWFLRDDDRVHTEDAEAAAPNTHEDHAPVEAPAPIPSAADPVNALSSSDALAAPADAAAADVLQPPPALDAAGIASTLAQQSVGGTAGAGRSDSRVSPQGIGQVTGSQTASASASQAAGAGRAERDKGGVAGLSQQERVRLVQRVARSFSRLGPDGGQVTLKLHPPQLGVLNMSVRIEGQSMTARLHTETASARDAILENLPVLRERLAEQGIEVESFQVEVTGDRNLAADNQSQSQTQSQNPFSGDPSSDSRSGPRSVDYRRLSRGNSSPQPFGAPTRATDSQRWSSHLPLGRTLDVRA